jgi:hypothetical protein
MLPMNYIRPETPEVEATVSQEEKIAHHVSAPALPEMQLQSIAQVLGMETETERRDNADKLELLLEYAKGQAQGDSLEDLKWVIRDLELSMGSMGLGEKKIDTLSRYVFLRMEKDKIEQELGKFNPYGKNS